MKLFLTNFSKQWGSSSIKKYIRSERGRKDFKGQASCVCNYDDYWNQKLNPLSSIITMENAEDWDSVPYWDQ